ncbi:Altered inheritance of mitochondria protein [Sphaerulina musiva]
MRRELWHHGRRACTPITRTNTTRRVHISATPSSTTPLAHSRPDDGTGSGVDARFEVLGAPASLLSATISASQTLYTRKGTLVGFHGAPENAVSSLSLLEPFRRALLGIPFLYQSISSTAPYTALIATKSPLTSLVVVHLDGRLDWMVARRNALLAWTGHTLSLKPRYNLRMSMAHWGNTAVTGRGLLALSGKGLIHQITLQAGDEYVVHPSHVIAYTIMQHAPLPYRFKSNHFRLQIPKPLALLPDTRFWRTMRESALWKFISQASFHFRTWTRRTIWGDRLFLHFRGPSTILVSSRGAPLSDVMTTQDINEVADSPAAAVPLAIHAKAAAEAGTASAAPATKTPQPTTVSYANVSQGNVKFDQAKTVDKDKAASGA